MYDAVNGIAERRFLGAIRAALLSPLRGWTIEVGAGTGASFPYYDASVRVLAIEPDRSMARRAELRASQAAADIEVVKCRDAALDDLPEESADHVVAMLLLCSVNDPGETLRRIHRVLKPDGTFVFLEHVRDQGPMERVQDVLTPFWKRAFGNCHLNRRISPALDEAGFLQAVLRTKRIPFPMRQLAYGIATKA